MISLSCPTCSKTVHVPPTEVGQSIECPHCQGAIRVPRSSGGSSGPNVGLILGLTFGGIALVVGFFMIIIVCLAAISVLGKRASGTFTAVGSTVGPAGVGPLQKVRAEDRVSVIEVPIDWTKRDLNKNATIQMGNELTGPWVIVITEEKRRLRTIDSVEKYAKIVHDSSLDDYDQPEVLSGPKEVLINGRKGIQYEFTGFTRNAEHVKIRFLDTSVEGEKHYHRILTWCMMSKYPRQRAQMEAAVNSFRELPDPIQNP
jgi:hypothetical protein